MTLAACAAASCLYYSFAFTQYTVPRFNSLNSTQGQSREGQRQGPGPTALCCSCCSRGGHHQGLGASAVRSRAGHRQGHLLREGHGTQVAHDQC